MTHEEEISHLVKWMGDSGVIISREMAEDVLPVYKQEQTKGE